jgi:hypothetical protein
MFLSFSKWDLADQSYEPKDLLKVDFFCGKCKINFYEYAIIAVL